MSQHHHHSSSKNIKVAFFLNFTFTLIEIVGAFYTNSLAILSDAIHDFGDSLSLGMSWFFQEVANKKPTKKYSYGYKRYSLLGAVLNTVILFTGSIFIIIEAIPRLLYPEQADAKGMMWLAILGILVNGAAVVRLKNGKTMNEKVVTVHLLEDVLGWIAVLIASIVMQFYDIPILDPLLSVVITCYILYNVYKNGKESIHILLQAVPNNYSTDEIKDELYSLDEVKEVHDCHLWSMDGNYQVFTAHILLHANAVSLEKSITLRKKLKHRLKQKFEIEHITLEMEIGEECEYINCN